MTSGEMKRELRAMWDAVLAGAFDVDSIDDLGPDQKKLAISMWHDEIDEHPNREELERFIDAVWESLEPDEEE